MSEIMTVQNLKDEYKKFGKEVLAQKLNVPEEKVKKLADSHVDSFEIANKILSLDDKEFRAYVKKWNKDFSENHRKVKKQQYSEYEEYPYEEEDYEDDIYRREECRVRREIALQKNEELIEDLMRKRTVFANIGTNKAKRRLNKLAKTNVIASAVRLAIEIEDKSITAKKAYDKYKDKIYNQKSEMIMKLCDLFKANNWRYGIQSSDNYSASHVIYFEIPTVEQISWHFSPVKSDKRDIPGYDGVWDKKVNSTMDKLEKATKELLSAVAEKM